MSYKNELNEKQYEAVCSKEQNLRIIAGAGSGKTRVLTYRIAYLIDEMKLWPFQILAITFTNKVAKEMKERTLGLIPNINASDLHIFTFHSWCANFLRREIDVLGIPSSFFIIDDQDQMSLLKNIGTDLGYKKTDEIIKEAYNFISKNKTLGQLPSDVEKNCKKETEKIYLNFFKEYEKRKSIAYYLDFDDLLIYSRKILIENSDIRLKYANRYKAILVDEFQDTNDLQYDIIKLLSTSSTKLYVVGDPDQTIYTWRGANQNIIINIDKDYYPMQTIVLDCNYRSTSSILNAANSLISNNQNRYKKIFSQIMVMGRKFL